ncbi:26045_t:CDS:2, partial [Gigaspora rosea]
IEPLEYGEQTFDINISNNMSSRSTGLQDETLRDILSSTIWSISSKMCEIIDQFENTILHQFLCIPVQFALDLYVIVPHQDFPTEIHDEDAHYSRLMAGFLTDNESNKIPISLNDHHLELLLFPDLYSNRHGYYYELRNQLEN